MLLCPGHENICFLPACPNTPGGTLCIQAVLELEAFLPQPHKP